MVLLVGRVTMSRDYRQLRVFQAADQLVADVYRATAAFPPSERYGLQAQLRRAAISTAVNNLEGSARAGEREYVHFLTIALGSASEVVYLLDLSRRLEFMPGDGGEALESRSRGVVCGLQRMITALSRTPVARAKPEAS